MTTHEHGGERDQVGLCGTCRHARQVPTDRTLYWLCGLAAIDPRFAKYPRLPVPASAAAGSSKANRVSMANGFGRGGSNLSARAGCVTSTACDSVAER